MRPEKTPHQWESSSPPNKPGNVDQLNLRDNGPLGLNVLVQDVQHRVRHSNCPNVWLHKIEKHVSGLVIRRRKLCRGGGVEWVTSMVQKG